MRLPDWMRSAGAVVVMTLALSGFARAGTFEDGVAAYAVDDYATALRLWRPLAERGDAEAQHNLGLMHAEGQGVPQDYVKALIWFRLAAEQGVVAARHQIRRNLSPPSTLAQRPPLPARPAVPRQWEAIWVI